jgi:mono/diheme cytochrome c family protein
VSELATAKSLLRGRQVLLTKCVACHDLRTVLTRPRTPSDWTKTVERMGERPVIGDALSDPEQWSVTAYLVAISPDLQNAAQTARKQKEAHAESKSAMKEAKAREEGEDTFKKEDVKPKYEKLCAQCHELDDVDKHAFTDEKDLQEIMTRMVDNGLEASPADLKAVTWYLRDTRLKKR